jgi:hypothetical protein
MQVERILKKKTRKGKERKGKGREGKGNKIKEGGLVVYVFCSAHLQQKVAT